MTRLMSECVDFLEEKTLLQDSGRKMVVVVDNMPNFHPKLAREGIEHSWGFANNTYHRLPITNKWGKDKFLGSVQKCLAWEKITMDLILKSVKQAQR